MTNTKAALASAAVTRHTARTLLLAALALLALAWLGSETAPAAFPGENGRIAFERNDDIWVIDPDGGQQTRLTCDGRSERPTWSPDGRKIAFVSKRIVSARSGEISVMDADGSNRRGLDSFGEDPVWSTTGERIAFRTLGTRVTEGEVHVIEADGSGRSRAVFFGSVSLTSQAWSPDGQRLAVDGVIVNPETGEEGEFEGVFSAWSSRDVIAFVRGPFSGPDIWTANPDGSDETQLTDTPESDGVPLWSPDGRRIAFRRGGDLWAMHADGSDQRRLASDVHFGYVWSPDGQQIVFLRAGSLWVMNADGTSQERLAPATDVGSSIDWQPLPAGANLGPPPSQFCFGKVRRNTKRGIARLAVNVPRPGRVIQRPRPGVKRFAQAHRDEGRDWVVLKVRPQGRALRRLNNKTNRVRVRAQVTYRPWVGEPITKGRRVWLVQR